MRALVFVLFAAFASLTFTPPARAEISFRFFYDSLDPYGDWVETRDYGYVWQPRDVDPSWRPYTDGYWTYTDSGWTWVSYEDFGWATYHYGRWVRLTDRGWCWVPGYEWGPAWVSWRYSDDNDVVGWAPLPPRAACRPGEEIDDDVDADYDIGPAYYSFTSVRDFGSPSLRQVIYEPADNVGCINRTRNVTRIVYTGDIVYNYGPRYEAIAPRCERPIERLQLERVRQWNDDDREFRDDFRGRRNGNVLRVLAPAVVPVSDDIRPRFIRARVDWQNEDHGWGAIHDQRQADDLRQKIRKETKNRKGDERRKHKRDEDDKKSVAVLLREEARRPEMRLANMQQPQIFRDLRKDDHDDQNKDRDRNKDANRRKVEPDQDQPWKAIRSQQDQRPRDFRRNNEGEGHKRKDGNDIRDREQRDQREHDSGVHRKQGDDADRQAAERRQHDRDRERASDRARDDNREKQDKRSQPRAHQPEERQSNNHRLSENQDHKDRGEKGSDKKKKKKHDDDD